MEFLMTGDEVKFVCPMCGQSKFSIFKDSGVTKISCNICGTVVKYIKPKNINLETSEEKLNYKKFFDKAKENISNNLKSIYIQHDEDKIERVLFGVYKVACESPDAISDRVKYILLKINKLFFRLRDSNVKTLAFNAWYAYAEYSDFLETHSRVKIGKYAEVLSKELSLEEEGEQE